MTNTTTELERQIEQMVAAHVAALRKAAQGEPAVTVATTNLPGGFGPTKSLEAEVADLKRRVARLEGIELCTVAEPSSPGDKLREQIREERKVRQSDGFRQIDTARRKPA